MKKKLDFNDILKVFTLTQAQIFVVSRLLKDEVLTEKEWEDELKKRKII